MRFIQRLGLMLCVLFCMEITALGVDRFDLTFDEIKQLDVEELQAKPMVEVYGQVVRFHSRDRGLFLFNGECGIYVQPKKTWPLNVQLGSWIRVRGTAAESIYNPIVISNETIVEKSTAPLQHAENFDPNLFWDPGVDCHWVSSSGVIVDYDAFPRRDHIMLHVEMFGYQGSIQIPYSEFNLEAASDLMFQLVKFNSVACVQANDRKQMIGRLFYISSINELIVDNPLVQTTPSLNSLEFFLNGKGADKYISFDGVITFIENRNVYLQDGANSIKIRTKKRIDYKVGDKVRVSGFSWSQPVSRGFRAAKFTKLAENKYVQPVNIDLNQLRDPDNNHKLISIEVELMDIGRSFKGDERGAITQMSFLCRAGEEVFECKIPARYIKNEKFTPGMRLKVSGIVNLEKAVDVPWRFSIERMWLQIRGLGDIKILSNAPWLTTTRLYFIVAIMVSIILVTLFFILTLRKTVHRQTALIGSQIKNKSIMSERQRIARELHDNLDQGLAGIALQLDSSIKLFEKDPESGLAGMKKIQEMLIYCSQESRNTILELRGGWLESMNLKEAIIQFADQLMEQHTIKIGVISEDNIQRLDRYVERQVFSIAKEAMTNACKHSNATEVIVKMKFSESRYELSLSDNGVGLINIDKDHKGHFGLLGMRERANRINGDLLIQPNDNSGARIKLTVSCE